MTLTLLVGLALTACAGGGASSGETSTTSRHATATATPQPLAAWKAAKAPSAAMALQFAPSNPATAYLCADNGPAMVSLAQTPRLYRSADGATTWSLLANAPVLQPVVDQATSVAGCSVFVDAQDAQDVFFQETQLELMGATHAIVRALYRSRDGGATWSTLATLDRTDGFTDIAVAGSRLIARAKPSVMGASGCNPSGPAPTATTLLYASSDGGATWQSIGQSIESAGYSVQDMATAGTTLFALTTQVPSAACQPSPGAALWRSTDGGATWATTALSEPIQTVNFTAKADRSGYYGIATATTSAQDATLTLFSQDSGGSWALMPTLQPSASQTFINAVMTPAGEAVAQADGSADVFVCRPASAAPQWAPLAQGGLGAEAAWQVVPTAQGTRLWSLGYAYNGPHISGTLAYLSLP